MKPTIQFLASIIFACFSLIAYGQEGTIRGFVYDKSNGEPIIFTNVVVEGTTTGAATDVNGYFTIPSIAPGSYNLVTSYLGYDTIVTPVTVKKDEITNTKIFLSEASIALDVVQVNAKRQAMKKNVQVSSLKLTNKDITRLPAMGGEADIAQYLQVVPGVVFSGEQGGQLYIRGGAPIQNKILLDGMPIYNAFHSIGVFSVFETDLIRNVDVLTGGFGSEYGGRLSAVVDITTRDGKKTDFGGKISVNPFMAKAIIEGPFSKFDPETGNSSSYVFALKKSLIENTSQNLYSHIDSLPYSFTDFYTKMAFNFENGSKFNAFGFNFNDGVNYQNSNLTWNNFGVGTKFIMVPSSSSTLVDGSFSYSKYSILLNEYGEFNRSSDISNFTGAFRFKYYLQDNDEIKYGIEINIENADFNFINTFGNEHEEVSGTTDLGAYFKYKKVANKDLVMEPGLRIQRYNALNKNSLEPRFGMKYNISDVLRFKFATGIYSQTLISAVSDQDVINLFTGFIFAPSERLTKIDGTMAKHSLQKSEHIVGGFELDVTNNIDFNVEGYYKNYSQLININRNKMFSSDPNYMTEKGNAYGIDFLVKFDHKQLYIWSTYSLAFTNRKMRELDGEIFEYPPHFDRRHNANLLASYKFGKNRNWEIGGKWNLGSGFPFTQVANFYEEQTFNNGLDQSFLSTNGELGIDYANLNQGRLPYFHRLDMTIKKSFQLGEDARMEVNGAVTNAYNRQNVFYIDRITNERVNQLPVIPSIGANITF